jgi:hypothetical protein
MVIEIVTIKTNVIFEGVKYCALYTNLLLGLELS